MVREGRAAAGYRYPLSRHEVASIDCLARLRETFDQTRRSSAGILGGVHSMVQSWVYGAFPTMYRISIRFERGGNREATALLGVSPG